MSRVERALSIFIGLGTVVLLALILLIFNQSKSLSETDKAKLKPASTAAGEDLAEQSEEESEALDRALASEALKDSSSTKESENLEENVEARESSTYKEARIEQILAELSLEEKVAQVFLVHYPPPNFSEPRLKKAIGGYLFFANAFTELSPTEVRERNLAIQAELKIPAFLAVDEEGGQVNRLSIHKQLRAEAFRSPRELYLAGGLDLCAKDSREKSKFLRELAFNLNLAPVADLSTNPQDFIYARSLGEDAASTAAYIERVVEGMQEEKIASCLKHFPGYGNNLDTHLELAYDGRDLANFWAQDLIPFKAGIEAGASLVLLSHNLVAAIDPELPASLSAKTVKILREDLGFEGVIICDDLAMEGVKRFAEEEDLAVLAFLAGNDLICTAKAEVQIPKLIAALRSGQIAESRLDDSLRRILKLKMDLALLE
ncbi:MAG: glycoside hydrolase family 3 N-terminal domain-containing protein [Eubacteriales bacterium]|nr:glycoside hydrolase family 3 N-terminal domain-containing protein [Eubacteriales bacterium]